jgi:hypothetical protein
MASKKKTPKKRNVNKTQFVLGHPNLSAKEVVDEAKKQGIKLSDKYVYNIRAKAKAGGGKAKGKSGRKPRAASGNGDVQAFVDLALIIGLDKATQLLQRLQEAVSKVVV